MTSPKHLWSGDWQDDSAARADELAQRRGESLPPRRAPVAKPPTPERAAPARPPPPPQPPSGKPTRPPLRIPRPSWLRPALWIAFAALVIAGAAFGLRQAVDTGSSQPASASARAPWLGIDMESLPVNRVVVAAVVPGGPAERAGLGPGDLITGVDQHAVSVPGDVTAAIAGMHPGDRVDLQIQRGPASFVAQVTLQGRPAGYP